jgi:hypothetical protein
MLLTVMNQGSSLCRARPRPQIALVVLQRRDQHFPRQREEALIESPGKRHRPLDQRGHFIEQFVADDRAAAWPASRPR